MNRPMPGDDITLTRPDGSAVAEVEVLSSIAWGELLEVQTPERKVGLIVLVPATGDWWWVVRPRRLT